MNVIDNFSNDPDEEYEILFSQKDVPVFQNKVYQTIEEAWHTEKNDVMLVQSKNSGFIYNRTFDQANMNYDSNYNNEQANSDVFRNHLNNVLKLLLEYGINDKKVVEVGCGKAVFFEKMQALGVNCLGFDPAYEGDNVNIIKDYYSEKYNSIFADVVVMRHTLEHISSPFSFLHTIARANNYKGKIFIEVPTFDWIYQKQAFWDVFYEHCNYFTEESLSSMFDDAITGNFFGGQYIYIWADLGKLKPTINRPSATITKFSNLFEEKFNYYKKFLEESRSVAIWGAGAKGSTFVNLLDKNAARVRYVIDINAVKQNKYMAGTAHHIYSPTILDIDPVEHIIVMNENYREEIERSITNKNIKLFNL